jgi:hypothetical protein
VPCSIGCPLLGLPPLLVEVLARRHLPSPVIRTLTPCDV